MENEKEGSLARVFRDRRIVIAIPVVIVLVALVGFFMAPTEYQFRVQDGYLALYQGKGDWLGMTMSKKMEPIPVGDMDVKSLTEKTYPDLNTALADYAAFIPSWIDMQQKEIAALEQEMETAYEDLAAGLRGAQAAGVQGVDSALSVTEDRLNQIRKDRPAK